MSIFPASPVVGDRYLGYEWDGTVWQVVGIDLNQEYSTTADLAAHEIDSTNVHGIADTSALATTSYVDTAESDAVSAANSYSNSLATNYDAAGSATTAQSNANTYTDTEISTHNSDTTNVHGIVDTSALATKTYADNAASTAAANLVDSAPSTLDTLNELAAALGDDPNFATTVAGQIGTKADASALTAHESGTTSVHGIANTADLATQTFVSNSISAIDALPSQSGQVGKYLSTDGSVASWENVDAPTNVALTTGASFTGDVLLALPFIVAGTTGATTSSPGTQSVELSQGYWSGPSNRIDFNSGGEEFSTELIAFFNLLPGKTLTINDSGVGIVTVTVTSVDGPDEYGVFKAYLTAPSGGGFGGPMTGATTTLSIPVTLYRVATTAPVTIPETSFFVNDTYFTTANVNFTSTYIEFFSDPSLTSGLPICYNTSVPPALVGYTVDGDASEVSRNAISGRWEVDSLVIPTWESSVAVPNETVPAHSLLPVGSEQNIDFVISPKGTGALLGAVPDNDRTGGDKRGPFAVDLQIGIRDQSTKVASGENSVIVGGRNNQASGEFSNVLGGRDNIAAARYSTAVGYQADTTGIPFSLVLGGQTGSQVSRQVLMAVTQNTTPQHFTTWSSRYVTAARTATNFTTLANNTLYLFKIRVLARGRVSNLTTTVASKAWEITGIIGREWQEVSTTMYGTPTFTVIGGHGTTTGWNVTVAAEPTFQGLAINAVGDSSRIISWTAEIELIQTKTA